jgi:quercetin dioxygenase-like cupin family protein
MQRVIYNPIFKDTVTFIRTSAETNGEISEMEVTLNAGGGNPRHFHSKMDETFTAVEGNLGLHHNGKDVILKPGESFTVCVGDHHRFFNPGKTEIKFHLTFIPGHTGAENMLRIMYGLASDGKTDKKGVPKSLTTIAVLSELGDTQLSGPIALLNPLFRWLATRGRKTGHDKMLLKKYCE